MKYNFFILATSIAQCLVFYGFVLCDENLAQDSPEVLPLWQTGTPGFESRKNEPEESKDWWVKNIHNPSIEIFKPADGTSNGVGVLVVPGGGHRLLVFNAEGREPAQLLADQGFTAFALKHRLAREENSPYSIEKHALEDGQRAMRLIRFKAAAFDLQPNKIGMLGFSAGGEVVSMVTFADDKNVINAVDEIDEYSSRPDFQMQVYPGPIGIPDSIGKDAPPAFFLVANDDGAATNIIRLMDLYRAANRPVEVHLFAKGGHGFNLGQRSKLKSIGNWPDRMVEWLNDYVVPDQPAEK